jgi:hypothetical protein
MAPEAELLARRAFSFADNLFCLEGNARPQPGLLPQEKEQLSRVTIFGEPSGQSRRGYFQRRGERAKKISNVALANSIFPPRLQKMV